MNSYLLSSIDSHSRACHCSLYLGSWPVAKYLAIIHTIMSVGWVTVGGENGNDLGGGRGGRYGLQVGLIMRWFSALVGLHLYAELVVCNILA